MWLAATSLNRESATEAMMDRVSKKYWVSLNYGRFSPPYTDWLYYSFFFTVLVFFQWNALLDPHLHCGSPVDEPWYLRSSAKIWKNPWDKMKKTTECVKMIYISFLKISIHKQCVCGEKWMSTWESEEFCRPLDEKWLFYLWILILLSSYIFYTSLFYFLCLSCWVVGEAMVELALYALALSRSLFPPSLPPFSLSPSFSISLGQHKSHACVPMPTAKTAQLGGESEADTPSSRAPDLPPAAQIRSAAQAESTELGGGAHHALHAWLPPFPLLDLKVLLVCVLHACVGNFESNRATVWKQCNYNYIFKNQ